MSLSLEVTDNSLPLALAGMVALLGNMAPVYKAIGAALPPVIDARFDSKTDPNGVRWEPWSLGTAYARQKEREDPHRDPRFIGTLMIHYGDMRASLSAHADATGVEIGFGAEYAVFHEQVGTSSADTGKMPRRGMLFANKIGTFLSESDTSVALAATMGVLNKVIRN